MRRQDGAFSRRFWQNIRRGGQVALKHRRDLLRFDIEPVIAQSLNDSFTRPAYAMMALLCGKQGQPAAEVGNRLFAVVIQHRGAACLNI